MPKIRYEPKTVALLDACVLYPPSLRDLLMWLATVGAYVPRLTDDIHAEWVRSVLADNPAVTSAQLARTRRLMNEVSPDCLVFGYHARIPALTLPDTDDRHVLAAAIEAHAAVIVTFNLSDFPAATLAAYGIAPLHPDVFLSALFDDDPALFLRAVRTHRASLKNPPKTAADYVQTLKATGFNRAGCAPGSPSGRPVIGVAWRASLRASPITPRTVPDRRAGHRPLGLEFSDAVRPTTPPRLKRSGWQAAPGTTCRGRLLSSSQGIIDPYL